MFLFRRKPAISPPSSRSSAAREGVRLTGLQKAYGHAPATLPGLDLEVRPGEFLVVVGPSGCGKSTLLRLLAGLETPTGGRIHFGEQDVTELPPQARDIAMVFQDYALYPHKTVAGNLGFGLAVRGVPRDEIARRVQQVAQRLQLDQLLAHRPDTLSGGQRQRVAIGRALVRQARLFLFDEPLSNLDVQLRQGLRAEIKRLHQQDGQTTVYVTHDQVEAMTLADRIAVLHGGELQQLGTPDEVYHAPRTAFVAGFIGSPAMNLLALPVVATPDGLPAVQLGDQFIPLPASVAQAAGAGAPPTVRLGVRPEHIARVADGLPATVDLVEPLGAEHLVLLDVQGHRLQARWPADNTLRSGQALHISISHAPLHWFDAHSGLRLQGSVA